MGADTGADAAAGGQAHPATSVQHQRGHHQRQQPGQGDCSHARGNRGQPGGHDRRCAARTGPAQAPGLLTAREAQLEHGPKLEPRLGLPRSAMRGRSRQPRLPGASRWRGHPPLHDARVSAEGDLTCQSIAVSRWQRGSAPASMKLAGALGQTARRQGRAVRARARAAGVTELWRNISRHFRAADASETSMNTGHLRPHRGIAFL